MPVAASLAAKLQIATGGIVNAEQVFGEQILAILADTKLANWQYDSAASLASLERHEASPLWTRVERQRATTGHAPVVGFAPSLMKGLGGLSVQPIPVQDDRVDAPTRSARSTSLHGRRKEHRCQGSVFVITVDVKSGSSGNE